MHCGEYQYILTFKIDEKYSEERIVLILFCGRKGLVKTRYLFKKLLSVLIQSDLQKSPA